MTFSTWQGDVGRPKGETWEELFREPVSFLSLSWSLSWELGMCSSAGDFQWNWVFPIGQITFFWPVFYKELARHMIWCPNDHAASFSRLYLVEVLRPLMNYYWQQFPPIRSQRSFFLEIFPQRMWGAREKWATCTTSILQTTIPHTSKDIARFADKYFQGRILNK